MLLHGLRFDTARGANTSLLPESNEPCLSYYFMANGAVFHPIRECTRSWANSKVSFGFNMVVLINDHKARGLWAWPMARRFHPAQAW